MRTQVITKELYTFDELSEKAKRHVISELYDINVDHDWWDFTYEGASHVGIEIKGFDLGRRQDIELTIDDCEETAKLILGSHGDQCDTYKIAAEFLAIYKAKGLALAMIGNEDDEAWMKLADQREDMEREFKKDMERCYFKMLQEEYDYLTSDEAIKETIEVSDYEFDEDGNLE